MKLPVGPRFAYVATLVWACLFAFFVLVGRAQAQACPVWPAAAASAPSGAGCLPEPKGSGRGLIMRANLEGTMAGYFCKSGSTWKPVVVAATWQGMRSLVIGVEAARALADADPLGPLASANQTLAQNSTLSLNDPSLVAVWCPHYAELMAGKPADDPPVGGFKVKKNGTLNYRPGLAIVNGKLVFSSTLRATVGTPCDPSVTIVSGTQTYMQYQPGAATICEPVN